MVTTTWDHVSSALDESRRFSEALTALVQRMLEPRGLRTADTASWNLPAAMTASDYNIIASYVITYPV